MRILKSLATAVLCLALPALPAAAQVGEADKCVKVHELACKKDSGQHSYMGLYVQNTCSRDISVFWRVDYHNATHPQLIQIQPDNYGVPWGYRSGVRHFVPRKVPPAAISKYQYIPCWKKLHYVYCAEYDPDAWRKLKKEAYLKKLPSSVCYSAIIKDPPETRDGTRFHKLTEFTPMVGGDYYSDRFKGKAAETNHISKLPRPAAN